MQRYLTREIGRKFRRQRVAGADQCLNSPILYQAFEFVPAATLTLFAIGGLLAALAGASTVLTFSGHREMRGRTKFDPHEAGRWRPKRCQIQRRRLKLLRRSTELLEHPVAAYQYVFVDMHHTCPLPRSRRRRRFEIRSSPITSTRSCRSTVRSSPSHAQGAMTIARQRITPVPLRPLRRRRSVRRPRPASARRSAPVCI